ncbi:MAG TPA: CsbD family protein [Nitrospiraceae bacterium]|nr:CsbD family protein [Nitrospiraceae bacterium]
MSPIGWTPWRNRNARIAWKKLTGDAKLEAEGKADKVAGKVQNAVGGIKDALKGK